MSERSNAGGAPAPDDAARPARVGDPAAVLARLEHAPAGNAELDLAVFLATGGADAELGTLTARLLAEGVGSAALHGIFGGRVPAYSRSLDAALPHEAIVASVYLPAERRWAAVHRGSDGAEVSARAASEALARRAAALRASLDAAAPDMPGASTAPIDADPPEIDPLAAGAPAADAAADPEREPWKVLF